ncbi:glycerophosphoryl diester phosphodiesterase [Hydrogenispora ethanolica]|jgi:glycerophosphoryl diester phosphodiesterase|uniref:Glycerophosphoryl diester phosphodiesterase n=1 Tax=Hydrogenispora ethanolica TaxID=1082276 RepID=A0A4R1S2A7_HYDET|nr:glycerophosphodiester phosphodiesterase [Hydrogenispora ethanolica]TCL73306.1 glycerophosphoryl diester phosphodiesterase [Hydrogenispora ethanolica]
MPHKILVTAHAGCMKTAMDSLESVYAGVAAGADVIEVDVRFAEGEIPVLSHDPLEPGQDRRPVRLAEVLEYVEGQRGTVLNLDLKETYGLPSLMELLRRTGMAERVFFTGLEPRAVPEVQRAAPGIPYLVDYQPEPWLSANPSYLKILAVMVKELGALGLNPSYQYVTEPLVDTFHAAGLKVYVWTVNRLVTMNGLIRLGVDSITTKRVDLLVQALREAGCGGEVDALA